MLGGTSANAANVTWTGSAADNDFNNPANWSGGAPNGNALYFNSSTLPVTGALSLSATGNYTLTSGGNSVVFNTGTTAYTITGGTLTLGNNSIFVNNSALTQSLKMDLVLGGNQMYLANSTATKGGWNLGTVYASNNAYLRTDSIWNNTGLTGATVSIDKLDITAAGTNGIVYLTGRSIQGVTPWVQRADLPSITIHELAGAGRFNFNSGVWDTITLDGPAAAAANSGSSNASQLNLSAGAKLVLDYTTGDGSRLGGRNLTTAYTNTLVLKGGGATAGELGRLEISARLRVERDPSVSGSATYMMTSVGRDTTWQGVLDIGESGLVGYNGTDVFWYNFSANNAATTDSNLASPYVTIGGENSTGRDFAYRGADNLYYAMSAGDYLTVTPLTNSNALTGIIAGSLSISTGNVRVSNLKITGGATSSAADNTLTISAGRELQLINRGLIFTGEHDYLIDGGAINSNNGGLVIWQSGQGTLTVSSSLWTAYGGLLKTGAGTLVLASDNSWYEANRTTWDVVVNNGTLVVGHQYALGGTNTNLRLTGGTLDLNGYNVAPLSFTGVDYYNSIVTNSAVTSSTLNLFKIDGSYSGLSYTRFDGDIRVLVTATSGVYFYAPNHFTGNGGLEFRGNLPLQGKTGVTPTNLLGSIALSNYRLYDRNALGDTVYFSGTSGLHLMMGPVGGANGATDGLFANFVISGNSNLISRDSDNVRLRGAWTGAADAEAMLMHNFGGGTTLLEGDMSGYAGKLWLMANYPRDNMGNVDKGSAFFRLSGSGANLSNTAVVLAFTGSTNLTSGWTAGYNTTYLEFAAPGTYQVGSITAAYVDKNQPDGNPSPYVREGQDGTVFVRAVGGNGAYNFEIGARGDSTVFDGHITNNPSVVATSTPVQSISWTDTDTNHPVSVNKVGTGTLTLTNLNTYTGTTTVSGGVLLLSGAADLSRTGAVTVSGGTLALSGNARISSVNATQINVSNGVLLDDTTTGALNSKTLNLNAGGVLGGNGVISTEDIYFNNISAGVTGGGLGTTGTLTVGGDQWWDNFTYKFDILSDSDHDLLKFTGAGLDLVGNQYVLAVNNLGGLTEFNDVLIISGLTNGFNLSNWQLDDGYRLWYDDVNTSLFLSYAAPIPEPSTWLLLTGGLTLLAFLRRRR